MYTGKIIIKRTAENDLVNVMDLWNNGKVMFYVGFPDGLNTTIDEMKQWLNKINQNELCRHYSIYTEDIGYCGETFYSVDLKHDLASLDIKLLPEAQGKGIAEYALSYAINQVFSNNLATRAYVEPHPQNKKAWNLYNKLGFISKARPEFLEKWDTYLEITKDKFNFNERG